MLNFKVDKTKDCIIINTDEWIQNSENSLKRYKMSGRSIITYLTEVVDKNIVSDKFKKADSVLEKGEIVLVSKVASEISRDRAFEIENNKYYNVPVMQVIGYFKSKDISLANFNLLYDKILVKKVELSDDSLLYHPVSMAMTGEVVKVGTNKFDLDWNSQPLTIKVGDKVLIKDNISTQITLDGNDYYAVEERGVVGVFNRDADMSSIKVINDYVLLQEYISDNLLGSDLLYTPLLDYEILDETDIYNRNMFKVIQSDSSIQHLTVGDVILADRNVTEYAYLNQEKYFILNKGYADAKVR